MRFLIANTTYVCIVLYVRVHELQPAPISQDQSRKTVGKYVVCCMSYVRTHTIQKPKFIYTHISKSTVRQTHTPNKLSYVSSLASSNLSLHFLPPFFHLHLTNNTQPSTRTYLISHCQAQLLRADNYSFIHSFIPYSYGVCDGVCMYVFRVLVKLTWTFYLSY